MNDVMDMTVGTNLRVVLYEGPGAIPLADSDRVATMLSLLEQGFEVTRPAQGQVVSPPDGKPLLVLGQFEKGGDNPLSQATLAAATATSTGALHFQDITDLSQDAIVDAACEVRESLGARKLGAWKPWFPVIDYSRCTNCMQCLSFCLFDVYGVDENSRITVQHESNCKTDCPACSRVCPEVAILFPKYKKGPINGDVVREEDVQREAMKVDVSALLGGDIYSSLKTRSTQARKRFSTERDESRALLERKRCLKKLKEQFDIPDEVLMTLPSAGDIQERAERAKAKLAKRMERSQTVQDARRPAPTEEEWGI